MDCGLLGYSLHGIFQARILEWVANSSSKGSSRPRDQTSISYIAGRFFTAELPGKPNVQLTMSSIFCSSAGQTQIFTSLLSSLWLLNHQNWVEILVLLFTHLGIHSLCSIQFWVHTLCCSLWVQQWIRCMESLFQWGKGRTNRYTKKCIITFCNLPMVDFPNLIANFLKALGTSYTC